MNQKKLLLGCGAIAAAAVLAVGGFFGWKTMQRNKAAKEAGIWNAGSHWGEAMKNGGSANSGTKLAEKLIRLKADYMTPENHVFCAIIPDKGYYLQEQGAPKQDYPALLGAIETGLADSGIQTIDLTGALAADRYFTTDSHWMQPELQPVMDALGSAMNFTVQLDSMTPHTAEGFAGAYGKYGAKPVDQLVYLTSPAIDAATVKDVQHTNISTVYDVSRLDTEVPYDIFLSGATPFVTITSPEAKTDRELVIFRDSFGSSIAPLLLEEYRTVTLVDIRYMISGLLPQYLEFADQDVLFLYSTLVADQSSMLR